MLYQVIAQGHVIEKLGRRCFSLAEAAAIQADVYARGYVPCEVRPFIAPAPATVGSTSLRKLRLAAEELLSELERAVGRGGRVDLPVAIALGRLQDVVDGLEEEDEAAANTEDEVAICIHASYGARHGERPDI